MSMVTKMEVSPALRGWRPRGHAAIPLEIESRGSGTNSAGHGAFAAQIQVVSFDPETPSEEGLAIPILGEIKPAWQGYNLFSSNPTKNRIRKIRSLLSVTGKTVNRILVAFNQASFLPQL